MSSLNYQTGICLKPQHYTDILKTTPNIGWFEVNSENYMGNGGPTLKNLKAIREKYPISLHGVSLSLGSGESLNKEYLQQLKNLIHFIDPIFVSEHLSWSWSQGVYLNDLLPLPYTEESFNLMRQHILETQDFIGREIFIENPSSYMSFKQSTFEEPEFLTQLCQATGCKILLDVNNVYVSGKNNHFDFNTYIDKISKENVGQIHLAGHSERKINGQIFRIDNHGSQVCSDVWTLYQKTIDKMGSIPTLIEWDTDVPSLSILLKEAKKAQQIMDDGFSYAANY